MGKVQGASVIRVFQQCVTAIRDGTFIRRQSKKDKEFHFQNWVQARLKETRLRYELGGRNSFPDFRMVRFPEGYEVKGLAYPGREANYDCNSQVPSGLHNGRTIFYIFGRYPAVPDGRSYPVIDLLICHGDFLNADHDFTHKNRSVKGFGSYGDIMIRDRKMYVAPTPFGLASGTAHTHTLILPADVDVPTGLKQVGELNRKEADCLIIGYTFDLRRNTLTPDTIPNPAAGKVHSFRAWRVFEGSDDQVSLRDPVVMKADQDNNEDGND